MTALRSKRSRTWQLLTLLSIGLLAAPGRASATPFNVGDVFTSVNNGQVQHYNSSLALLETLNTGVGGFTTGSASDSTGNLYVTNFSAGSVTKFTGPGDPHTPSIFLNQSGLPESILFDKSGNVFVSSAGTGFIGKYSAAGGLLTSFNTGKGRADWIDLSGDQSKIFFTIDIQKGVLSSILGRARSRRSTRVWGTLLCGFSVMVGSSSPTKRISNGWIARGPSSRPMMPPEKTIGLR